MVEPANLSIEPEKIEIPSPPSPVEVPPPAPVLLPPVVKEKKESMLFYILAGVLIVAGLLFSAYNFMQKKNSPTAPVAIPTLMPQPTESIPTPTPDVTASWETYIDTVYGFQITIPKKWYIYPTGGLKVEKVYPGDSFTASTYDIKDQKNFDAKSRLLASVQNPLLIEILISTDSNSNKTLEQEKTELISKIGKDLGASPLKITQVIDYSLDSKPALKVFYNEKSSYQISLIGNKNYFYRISYFDRDITSSNQLLIDQILSTFKFTN